MRFVSVVSLLFASATAVLAQTMTTTAPLPGQTKGSECDAKLIVDACIQDLTPQYNSCGPADYKCLCEQNANMLTCYNNCPHLTEGQTYKVDMDTYCNAAKQLSSTTTTTTSTSAVPTTSHATTTTKASETGTFTPSPTTDAAVKLGVGMGGGLVGLVALGLAL